MGVIDASIDIAAPPERVWKVVADPRNLPVWDRHIAEVTGVPPGGLKAGSRYTTSVRFLGVTAHVESRVLELQPPHYAKVQVDGLLDATVETWLTSLDGGGTRLRHRADYTFKGGPLGTLAARALQMLGGSAVLRRGMQAQRRQAEAQTP